MQAAALLRRDPSAAFSVAELAHRAGLAKGTVYLSLRKVMQRPEMAIFGVDFEKQLVAALLDLWAGVERRGRKVKR